MQTVHILRDLLKVKELEADQSNRVEPMMNKRGKLSSLLLTVSAMPPACRLYAKNLHSPMSHVLTIVCHCNAISTIEKKRKD